jgi:hypothetical protein
MALTTFIGRLSRNSVASTSWNPKGLSWPVEDAEEEEEEEKKKKKKQKKKKKNIYINYLRESMIDTVAKLQRFWSIGGSCLLHNRLFMEAIAIWRVTKCKYYQVFST